MRFLVRAGAEVPDDKWPYIVGHGEALLRSKVAVARADIPGAPGLWTSIEPDVWGTWGPRVRYVAALVFEALIGGTAFVIDEDGQPRAWPQAERDRELREWVLTPPSPETTFLIPEGDYEQAALMVRVERELGEDEVRSLRRVLGDKCAADGGICFWFVKDGSTTMRVVYNFRYWEPGDYAWEGFDEWWLAAECMEAWTGGSVTWCFSYEDVMSFDKARRDAMLRYWPMQHVENTRKDCRGGGRVNISVFGDGQHGLADIVAAEEDRVLLRYLSGGGEQWLPYYRIRICLNV